MENVRYNLMRIALELAEKNLHSAAYLIVSPSDHGKTDTLRLFSQAHDGVWIVPPTSSSRLTDFFRQRRNITMISVDEPYDWISADYRNVAMMCKHVIEGRIKAPRSTVFNTSVDMSKSAATAIVLLCNDVQYDIVRRALAGCGLLERSITVMCQNSNPDTLDYIEQHYRTHRFESIRFADNFRLGYREPSEDEKKFIDRYFTGYQRRTIQWIARMIPPDTFEEFKPYFVSGQNNEFVEENIRFEE